MTQTKATVMLASKIADQFITKPLMIPFAMIVDREPASVRRKCPSPSGIRRSRHSFLIEQPLRVRIGVRRSERCTAHTHTRLEQLPNGGAPFLIAVADQEASSVEHAVARIGELAYDLEHESLVRVRRADDGDAPPEQLNDEHGVVRTDRSTSRRHQWEITNRSPVMTPRNVRPSSKCNVKMRPNCRGSR